MKQRRCGQRVLGPLMAHAARGPGAIGSTQVFPGDDAAAQGDWVSTSGTRMTFDGGLGAMRSVEHGVWACSPCVAPPTPVRGVPGSSHRRLRVWVACAACVGRFRVQPGALVASGGGSASGGDRRRRGRWWAALATCGGGVGGGHGGGLKERGATSFDLMWRRLNFRARARKKWLRILCNILCTINSLLA